MISDVDTAKNNAISHLTSCYALSMRKLKVLRKKNKKTNFTDFPNCLNDNNASKCDAEI